MNAAIEVNRLGKRYTIGAREPYGAMRDSLARALSHPLSALRQAWRGGAGGGVETIWALRDVSVAVPDGGVVGIIGRNGSGKSTLLKILSRITEPTEGRARVRGRVGSLLEVGTGFHPELTGRENVFVNGAILGMTRRDIASRFDRIVEFAGVERFIDTPVKHYSSGMQMRLAFAVAAHLEPHILLVDEVLAVGDAEFQRRCLGKMQDAGAGGRTVLLVSHQMGQIRRLCETVIWLDGGRVRQIGPAAATIQAYEAAAVDPGEGALDARCFLGWELGGGGHVLTGTTHAFTVRLHLKLEDPVVDGHLGLSLADADDRHLAGWAFEPLSLDAGVGTIELEIAQLPLNPGRYRFSATLFDRGNNLTGGRLIEKWVCMPDLVLDVRPLTHPQDAFAGVLNVPARLTHHEAPPVAVAAVRASA